MNSLFIFFNNPILFIKPSFLVSMGILGTFIAVVFLVFVLVIALVGINLIHRGYIESNFWKMIIGTLFCWILFGVIVILIAHLTSWKKKIEYDLKQQNLANKSAKTKSDIKSSSDD